jgi:hypothetical protein
MKPEHQARRKIIREWMSLPKDKRQIVPKKAMERIPLVAIRTGRY